MSATPPNETLDMMLNMGPQHPATHGVFRMVLSIDGERVIDVVPHIGYLHRGSEKLCENEFRWRFNLKLISDLSADSK